MTFGDLRVHEHYISACSKQTGLKCMVNNVYLMYIHAFSIIGCTNKNVTDKYAYYCNSQICSTPAYDLPRTGLKCMV